MCHIRYFNCDTITRRVTNWGGQLKLKRHLLPRPTLKNCSFPITRTTKEKWPGQPVKLFTSFKLNITFYFKCYLHDNWAQILTEIIQLYSSAKPWLSVPSCVFRFVKFCFLPFLCRSSVQKWKKNCFLCTQMKR